MEKENKILEILDLVQEKVLSHDEALPQILLLFSVSGQLPLDFVKWYSGMEEEKILKAYKRWKNESGNLRSCF